VRKVRRLGGELRGFSVLTNCYGLYMSRIYRYQMEDFFCWTQTIAAVLQTGLFVDFLYYYFKSVKEGKPVRYELPV
jgi:restriction endonuclease S subunit